MMSKKNKVLWNQMTFMPFIGLQTFKVKLFLETHCGAVFLGYLKTEVTPKILAPFFSMILKKLEF